MSHSPKLLKGGYLGGYIREYYRGILGVYTMAHLVPSSALRA